MSEPHKEMRNLMRAYAAFQVAIVLYIVKNPTDANHWSIDIVLTLFCISIPSSIAYAGLARLSKKDEAINPNPISAVSQILAFVPSILAICIIVSTASVLAAVVFFLGSVIWVYSVVKLRKSQGQP